MNINKIETSANILIIALAIILSIILAQKFFFNSSSENTEILKAGEKVSLAGVNFGQSEKTILIALNPDCPFCTESAPFYRLLGESTFQNKNIRLIGLFSTEVESEKDYIEKLDVKFDALQKTSFENLKIPSTPTIIVIGKDGLVISVWRGKLSSDEEQEFLSRLK